MSENATWETCTVRDVIEHHFCGPSPDCEERQIFAPEEWGVLKTTAITWAGWNEAAHKVLPKAFWEQPRIEVHAGDVLVTKAGPRHRVGVVCHVPSVRSQLVVSGKMIGLRPRPEVVNARFLAGLLGTKGPQKYIHDHTTGMAESQVNFANKVLLDAPLRLPPVPQQHLVAQILDTLDTAIHETKALIDKLKAVKQGLLHDLLTRGIDSNGQLRPPHSDEPQLYKESPLGWIPREWECREFSVLAEYLNGNTFDAAEWTDNGFPIIRIQNLNGSRDFNYYAGAIQEKWHVHPGDLLFAWSGQRGVSFGARLWDGPEGVLNQHIFRVLPKVSLVSKMFLFRLLRFRQMNIEDAAHGFKDSFLHVTRGELGSVNAGVPSLDEQERIELRIAAYESKLLAEEAELGKLQSMKSGLMDDLLTGRVRVTPLLESVPVAPIDQQPVRQMGT